MSDERHSKVSHKASDFENKESRKKKPPIDKSDEENSSDTDHSHHKHKKHKKKKLKKTHTTSYKDKKKHKKTKKSKRHSSPEKSYSSKRNRSRERKEEKRPHKCLDSNCCKDNAHRKRHEKEPSDQHSKPKRLKSNEKDTKPNQNATSLPSNSSSNKPLIKRGVNLSHLHEETSEVDEAITEVNTGRKETSPLNQGLNKDNIHHAAQTKASTETIGQKEESSPTRSASNNLPSKEFCSTDDPSSKDQTLEVGPSVNKNVNTKPSSYISCAYLKEIKEDILNKDDSQKETSGHHLKDKPNISSDIKELHKTTCIKEETILEKEVEAEIHSSYTSLNQKELPLSSSTTTHTISRSITKLGTSHCSDKGDLKEPEREYSSNVCTQESSNQSHQTLTGVQNEGLSKSLKRIHALDSPSLAQTSKSDDSCAKKILQQSDQDSRLAAEEKIEKKKETISPSVNCDFHDVSLSKAHEDDFLDNQHFTSSLSTFIFSELEKYMHSENKSKKSYNKTDKDSLQLPLLPNQIKENDGRNEENHENNTSSSKTNEEDLAKNIHHDSCIGETLNSTLPLPSEKLNKNSMWKSFPSSESISKTTHDDKKSTQMEDGFVSEKNLLEASVSLVSKGEPNEITHSNLGSENYKNLVKSEAMSSDILLQSPLVSYPNESSKDNEDSPTGLIHDSSENSNLERDEKMLDNKIASNGLIITSLQHDVSLEINSLNSAEICNKEASALERDQEYKDPLINVLENQKEIKDKPQINDSFLIQDKNGRADSRKSRSKSKEKITNEEKTKNKSKEIKSKEDKKSRERKRSRSRSNHKRKSHSKERHSRSRSRLRKSRSRERWRSRSRNRRKSRSKERRKSRSKERKKSRSKERRKSRSKERRRSRSKERRRSRSRERRKSRSRERRKSRSRDRRKSRSKERKKSRSRERRKSRSKERRKSRSRERKKSRSRERKKSRSKERRKSRSKERRRSRSKERKRSRSKERRKSRSKERSTSRNRTSRETKSGEVQISKSKERRKSTSKERSHSKTLEIKKETLIDNKKEIESIGQQMPFEQERESSTSEERDRSQSVTKMLIKNIELEESPERISQSREMDSNQKESETSSDANKETITVDQTNIMEKEAQNKDKKIKDSRERSSSKSSRERSVVKTKKISKELKSDEKNKRGKKRSKSKEKKRSSSREKRRVSPERRRRSKERRKSRSRSIERRRSRERKRSLSRGRRRSLSRIRNRQRELQNTRRTSPPFRISPPRRFRSRSRSHRRRSRSRSVEKIDKAQLLEAARKNMLEMIEKGAIPQSLLVEKKPLKPIVMPIVHSSAPEPIALKGKSVDELTDMCRAISEKERKEEAGNDDSSEDSKGSPIIFHPFKIKESQPTITMNIRGNRWGEESTSSVKYPLAITFGQDTVNE